MTALGLDKPAHETRVVVAMSGGVDSSATAGLLAEQGFDVVGVTLQLYDHGQAAARPGSCCAGPDIRDARRVAERLGIPHYVLDFEDKFRNSVIDDFADTYLRGETPNPCIRCNQTVKFRDLLETARELGADLLATGHYARWKPGPELWAGDDPVRDQSYFLFATTREQLGFLRFPLGTLDKGETRAIAERLGLPVAAKPDSQDICFVPDGNYADVVTGLRPAARVPGDIVHVDGTVLGRHDGVVHYTVGQRRGLGIGGRAAAEEGPLYVVRLEPEAARVVVGPKDALLRRELVVGAVNWLDDAPLTPMGRRVAVKLRSAMAPVAALLLPGDGETVTVRLEAAHRGVAPGQACVFYDGGRVLGGGWIRRDGQPPESGLP